MANVHAFPNREPLRSAGAEARRVEQSLELIRTLVESLPPEARELVARELARSELTHEATPISVLAKVVSMLPPQQTVTVSELKQQIVSRGVGADAKEIYNAISYMARKGKLRRVGYGRYVVDGVEIATSDDLGGASARHEDPYRTDPGSEG